MGSEHRRAWEDYQANLQRLRDLAPVTTICMHGSPLSRINNLDLWQTYDYKELGIVGDPYLDVDFSQVFYITDTGRRWNHETSSVRDRVGSGFHIEVKSTEHLIELISGQKTASGPEGPTPRREDGRRRTVQKRGRRTAPFRRGQKTDDGGRPNR